MSSYAGIVIGGLEVHEFTDHYDRWFFRKSDRVIECMPYDEDDRTSGIFIGYRATAATIRRRMALAGLDLPACERYFTQGLGKLLDTLQNDMARLDELVTEHIFVGGQRSAKHHLRVYRLFFSAVRDTSLADWITAFPEAVTLKDSVKGDFFDGAWWCDTSKNPLVNAMLSYLPTYNDYLGAGIFNFPVPHRDQFTVALLASFPDDVVCELNIAELMTKDDDEDFRDHEELQEKETEPHWGCCVSVREIKELSDSQPDNPSLQRMCYASIITAMEAYLGDILKREIFSRPAVKQRFVESYLPFKDKKMTISDLYDQLSRIDTHIKDALDGMSLHKMDMAKNIFSKTLSTEFPETSLPFLSAAVKRRHDIVHRNGRDKEGELLPIGHNDITELAREVQLFTRAIDAQILNGMQQDIATERE